MKTTHLLILALFVMMGSLLLAGQSQVAAQDVNKEDVKGDWILHSQAPGDSLVTGNPICSRWLQILLTTGGGTCWNGYHCYGWNDNNDGLISPCDELYFEWDRTREQPNRDTVCYKMHVKDVTVTLVLTLEPDHLDTMYVEFEKGWTELGPAYADSAIKPPVVCSWWHEVLPNWCQRWHINSWIDTDNDSTLSYCDTIDMAKEEDIEWWHVERVIQLPDSLLLSIANLEDPSDSMRIYFSGSAFPDSVALALEGPVCTKWHEIWPNFCQWWHLKSWHDNGNGYLDVCDTIDMVRLEDISWWHVEDVAIDITLDRHNTVECPPETPSVTQWGIIVLVALLIASAIYIMLRRKKAAVPA